MPEISLKDCFRELDLQPSAGGAEIKRAFRRLAKAYHPDLQRGHADAKRFIRIVEAYTRLRQELRLHTADDNARLCPECRQTAELLESPDGRIACVDCLLGVTRRRLLLPFPMLRSVKHAAVIALEGVSIACLCLALARGSLTYGAVSLASGMAALATLAATCVTVKW